MTIQKVCGVHGRVGCDCRPKRRDSRNRRTLMGNGARGRAWRRVRRVHLRAFPWCMRCGRVAVDVHHRDGLGPCGPRGLDHSNLESLCKECHGKETRQESLRKESLATGGGATPSRRE